MPVDKSGLCGKGNIPFAVLVLLILPLFSQQLPGSEEPYAANPLPLKGRSSALLTALFHYDAPVRKYQVAGPLQQIESERFSSSTPAQVGETAERAKIIDFSHSLIYEGGFFPKEIYQLLGIDNPSTSRVARLTRQLDKAANKTPAPWEVAGRIGRSGIAGASDNWAMAPGEYGEEGMSSPGTLAYLPALAVAYAAYPQDGMEAASQLAVLKDDDMRAEAAARTAISLLMRVLVAERPEKNKWLVAAAADAGDPDTERDIRSVRVKDWRYLRGEECAMGRLERAVYLWYKGDSYISIMTEGAKRLRSREGLAYLAALTAATYGMESLPDNVVARGASDPNVRELITDLYDLGTSEAVLRVETPED